MHRFNRGITYHVLYLLNRLHCRLLYQLPAPPTPPLPATGPVLVVSNHSSLNDPMVLAATAGRPIIFLTAREVFLRPYLRWLCHTAHYIPVTRGATDVGAVRALLRALKQDEVVSLFPEGGIDEHREERGHPGVAYLALKTGAPVVPASIAWSRVRPLNVARAFLTPGRVIVRYGAPIVVTPDSQPDRETISAVTAQIMEAMRNLGSRRSGT